MTASALPAGDLQTESQVSDYFALLKPRVMSLVVFTGLAGMMVAPGFGDMHPVMIFAALLSLAVGAGASGAVNMWFDRDIDAVMDRTKNRPLPMGRVDPSEALTFATVLSVLSIMTMGFALNWMAAGLLAFASFFYVFIYTLWLKRRTPQNIVIGGAAGAFPPMIGWAAVTGDMALLPVILFAIIFLWTPPHFWALSLFSREDYARAKVPMLPAVKGETETRRQILLYTLLLVPASLAPAFLGQAGIVYTVSAVLLGALFLWGSVRVTLDRTYKSARLLFGYSVFYLFALFLALMIDAA